MQKTYTRGQADKLQNTVLKKREKTPVWQIRGDCNYKTASPQRYTQEPLIKTDIFYKKIKHQFRKENITIHKGGSHNTIEKYALHRFTTHERGRKEICKKKKLRILFYFQFSIYLSPLRHRSSR